MASFLAGERNSCGRLAFVSAVSVNTARLVEPLLQSSEHFVVCVTSNKIMYCEFTCLRTSSTVRDRRVNSMLLYSWCVPSLIIRSGLSPTVHSGAVSTLHNALIRRDK